MCGIAGTVSFDGVPASPEILKRMTDAIAHRGPNGEGQYIDGNVGLGHRRLSIIDLSQAAHQPMQVENDGCYVITYNGEVYNYRELRIELENLGHKFYSTSDTEVVLKSYAQWKEACVTRFNGMFAFAVYDKEDKTIFMARDRYGIKPLYYTFQNKNFLFASEIKAITRNPAYSFAVDKEALLEYMTFQNFFTEKTLYKNIHTFPAGHYATLSLNQCTSEITPIEYWDYSFEEPEKAPDENECIEELDRLFCQAVKRQLVADVEIGSYLSGGMDSGAITAVAAAQLPYMKTFTCGFDLNSASGMELNFDERQNAEYMSYKFKTEHYEMVLKSGDMERCMKKVVNHIEEPRVGQSYPNYYAAQLASKFVKVVLGGTGGDELFGGYPWRYYRAVVNDDFEHYIDKYYKFWQRLIPNTTIHKIFAPIWSEVKHVWTKDIFRDVFHRHAEEFTRPENYVNHSLYFEAKTFLHGLLTIEDKLSMAHGLESRVPFLDNDLVDFSMKLPVSMKLGNLSNVVELNENEPGHKTQKYFQKTKDGKLILRKLMERYIPPSITNNIKQGFSAPDASWFKGESIEYVKRVLFSNNTKIYDFMDRKETQFLINEHLEGKQNRRLLIWSLINLEKWFQEHCA
jgi:asparagine synthase (glutamine-hydrolysing)